MQSGSPCSLLASISSKVSSPKDTFPYPLSIGTECTTSSLGCVSPDILLSTRAPSSCGQTTPCEPPHNLCPNVVSNKPGIKVVKAGYSKVKRKTTSLISKAKPQPLRTDFTPSPSARRNTHFSTSRLDARLATLDNVHPDFAHIPTLSAMSKGSSHRTTIHWRGEALAHPRSSSHLQTHFSESRFLAAKSWKEQAFFYLAAELIAIPNLVLSWSPMAAVVVILSFIAILCGYRYAVAIPFFMFLNPGSPLWCGGMTRDKGSDVLVFTSQRAPSPQSHLQQGKHFSDQKKKLSIIARRHSIAV